MTSQQPSTCEYSGLRSVESYREEVSPQDTPAIEDTIKAIDKKIKELEEKRINTLINTLK